jgi:hypothetical protein
MVGVLPIVTITITINHTINHTITINLMDINDVIRPNNPEVVVVPLAQLPVPTGAREVHVALDTSRSVDLQELVHLHGDRDGGERDYLFPGLALALHLHHGRVHLANDVGNLTLPQRVVTDSGPTVLVLALVADDGEVHPTRELGRDSGRDGPATLKHFL